MSNYFNILGIGLKGLQAQKKSMDVAGHNIANANTEGYSKQRAVQKPTDPFTKPGMNMPTGAGQMGTGVEVERIERIRNKFIDGQIQEKKQSQGYWKKRYDGLHRLENIFNEPSENSLNSTMNKFWNSLEDLSNNPEDTAVRTTVRERAKTLADSFHTLDDQMLDYKRSLNSEVETTVKEINSLAERIADLNEQIVKIKGSGQQPNDLMDQRDLLFEKMNRMINVQGNYDQRGNLDVNLDGMGLVAGDSASTLTTRVNPDAEYQEEVVFAATGEAAAIKSGGLAGIMNIRDQEITKYREELDQMAKGLVDEFNRLHGQGYDLNGDSGGEFFEGLSQTEGAAGRIEVSSAVKKSVNKIAAGRFSGDYSDNSDIMTAEVTNMDNVTIDNSYEVNINETTNTYNILENGSSIDSGTYSGSGQTVDLSASTGLTFTLKAEGTAAAEMTPAPGNSSNAMELSDVIKEDKLFNEGKATIQEKYQAAVSTLGVEGQRADQMVDNQDVLVEQLENQRQSISGVSLDEEMANMIKYQQAYNASAKVISTSNQMLDSLMNMIR